MIPIENVKLTLKQPFGEDVRFFTICKAGPSVHWSEMCEDDLYPGRQYTRSMNSDRLGYMDADIEGSDFELIDVAKAIKEKRNIEYKRVGIECCELGVYLYSPRNSHTNTMISWECANRLSETIIEMLETGNKNNRRRKK